MTASEAARRESLEFGNPEEVSGDSVVARALTKAARALTHPGLRRRRSTAKTRDVRRVLLVAPPSDSANVVSAGILVPLGLATLAESLRKAGFEAEIYDMASSLSAESMRLHIEHAFPHVVVAVAYAATAEAARDVLRAAKEVAPGAFTVILGAQEALGAGKARRDVAVDCVVGDDAQVLPAARPPQGGRAAQADRGISRRLTERPASPSTARSTRDHAGKVSS
jgi:hypothetical protein